MQTNYRVRCNICGLDIESKNVLEHTSAKEHDMKKTTLECELLNVTSMKRDLEDFSLISMWIAGTLGERQSDNLPSKNDTLRDTLTK